MHGILFLNLGIKLPCLLTAHHEAFGAERVSMSGVKFDKLLKTNSGQPIFPVDKETAHEIRATFVIDLALIHSFGHSEFKDCKETKSEGLNQKQKEFLLTFSLWKIGRLFSNPYRFRSGCDLKLDRLTAQIDDKSIELRPDDLLPGIRAAIEDAGFENPRLTKVYWPEKELFKAAKESKENEAGTDD